MKRGQPPARRTPLKSSSGLRRGALLRNSSISRTAATRKPARRDPAEAKARKAVKARSLGRCEVDGVTAATEMHHRQNRSQGGSWTPENLMHICSVHHLHITTHPQAAREQGWSVPSYMNPARTPVWIARRGFVLLNNVGDYIEIEEAA
jgi:5-methylcytosine-specific restriction endonuclease McrA